MAKILNSKMVIMRKYQNRKTFLQRATLQIGLRKFLWPKKYKILYHGQKLLMILTLNRLLEHFTKMSCEREDKTFSGLKS